MKKSTKYILIVEIQIILGLIVFLALKINTLDKRVYNTNKFVHELLEESKKNDLLGLNFHDIIVGNLDAPVTIILYSRFDCFACSELVNQTYNPLIEGFIKNGQVKLVPRFLVHSSKPETLYATKSAYFANSYGLFSQFIESLNMHFPDIELQTVQKTVLELTQDTMAFNEFIENQELESFLLTQAQNARQSGITSTPTLFINGQKVVGAIGFKRLQEIISKKLN